MASVHTINAYEKADGWKHIFETFKHPKDGYMLFCDGNFVANRNTIIDIEEEIEDTINWYNWTRLNPNFA